MIKENITSNLLKGDQRSSNATHSESRYDDYPGSLRRSDQHEEENVETR